MRSMSLYSGGQNVVVDGNTALGYAWTILTGGDYITYGAWVEVIASADFDIGHLLVMNKGSSPSVAQHTLRVGVGASGAEEEHVVDIHVRPDQRLIPIDVHIKKGDRVSLSILNSGTSTITVQVIAAENRHDYSRYTSLVNDLETYLGYSLDPGATINTKGGYFEITASTPFDVDKFSCQFFRTGASTMRNWAVDFAIGASGSEINFISDLLLNANVWATPQVLNFEVPKKIARGERISARCQSDNITVGQREIFIMPSIIGR